MKKILIILLFPLFSKAQLGVKPGIGYVNSSFSPSSIAGLKFWVKADQITGLSDGDPVSTWTDQSGIGNTVTSSGASRPTYKTSILNSLPVVRFAGSHYMNKSSFTGVDGIAGMTVFLVVKQTSLATSNTYLSKWLYSSQGSFAIQTDASTTGEVMSYVADACGDAGGNNISSTTASLTTTFYLIEFVYDGSLTNANRVKFYKNTSGLSTAVNGTLPTALTTCTADFEVGRFNNLSRFFNGDFGEIIVYNSALSDVDRGLVEVYLNTKWAIY